MTATCGSITVPSATRHPRPTETCERRRTPASITVSSSMLQNGPTQESRCTDAFDDTEATDNDAAIQRRMQRLARQASLDPGDGIQL